MSLWERNIKYFKPLAAFTLSISTSNSSNPIKQEFSASGISSPSWKRQKSLSVTRVVSGIAVCCNEMILAAEQFSLESTGIHQCFKVVLFTQDE